MTGPAVLEWLKKTKKSFSVETKTETKELGSDDYGSEDEDDEIPIIEKSLLQKFVAEVSDLECQTENFRWLNSRNILKVLKKMRRQSTMTRRLKPKSRSEIKY